MTNPGTRASSPRTEIPMLRAYRLWFEHTKKCADCKRVHKATDGCEIGQELWATYRRSRARRPETGGGP